MAGSTAPEKRGKKATQTEPPAAHAAEEQIVSLPLAEFHPFPNHPFRARDGDCIMKSLQKFPEKITYFLISCFQQNNRNRSMGSQK